jgi:hypothetical protein
MDIFFADPSEVPLPPAEVRIRQLKAEPSPDGLRVRVYFEVDPFQKRPNAELFIIDDNENEAASVSIIESMNRRMELTMHLRNVRTGRYILKAVLFYSKFEEQDAPIEDIQPIEQTVVDTAETAFYIEE